MALKSNRIENQEVALHPNAQKLLDVAIDLLDTTPVEQVTLASVLERSGVSNGSLYHHFEDFQDLLEHAIVHRFTAGLNESHAAIARLLDITNESEFREAVQKIVFTFHDQNRRPFRMARLETLGALTSRPRLAERIGRAQFESNMKQAGYFAELQQRGWLRSDLDAAAISTFMTATFLGRVVDDIASEQIEPSEWTRVSWEAFKAILFPD
ncbi:MAG: hypothetical protein RIR69_1398 [Actinomycetota bacterium]|jgi:AcrR family transcriptional regulator